MNCLVVIGIFTYSICNLLKNLAAHRSYDYQRLKVIFIIQGLVIVLGLIAGEVFAFFLYRNMKDQYRKADSLPPWGRYMHVMGAIGPTIVLCFIVEPDCLFTQINAFPEQTERVSIVQYSRSNHSRFLTTSEVLKRRNIILSSKPETQNEAKPRMSQLLADRDIDNCLIISQQRISMKSVRVSDRQAYNSNSLLTNSQQTYTLQDEPESDLEKFL